MQKIEFALFQIVHAKKFLQEGSLPAIRTAFMLLDNSAELLMDRQIEDDMGSDEIYDKIRTYAQENNIPNNLPGLERVFSRRYLNAKEKGKLARFFDEKVTYHTKLKKYFPQYIGNVLSHLHRYRNQVYHSGNIRSNIFITFAYIYIELCCRLLEYIQFTMISSAENSSWLKSNFGINSISIKKDELPVILQKIREGVFSPERSLQTILIENLEQRIKGIHKNLHFISIDCGISEDENMAFNEARKFTFKILQKYPPYEYKSLNLEDNLSYSKIAFVEKNSNYIKNCKRDLFAFKKYADLDILLERIEFIVNKFVEAINESIQMQIDIERGK
jgi:hypothetical protein